MTAVRRVASQVRGKSGGLREGFTLIELMVVIAIIILAAGVMTPTITDFFRNRKLDSLTRQIGAAFNFARLQAVNQGARVSMVFFREGVRIYDEKTKTFVDELFNPETSPASGDQLWYDLGFLNGRHSTTLYRYRKWEDQQIDAAVAIAKGKSREEVRKDMQYSIHDSPKITFQRDGSLVFGSGADVSSALFKEPIPPNADIIVYQVGNHNAGYIDMRLPGQLRSKMVARETAPEKPPQLEDEDALGRRRTEGTESSTGEEGNP